MNDLTQKAFGLSGRCSMRAYNEVSGGVFVAQSGEASSGSQAGEWSMKTRSSSSSSECEGQKEQPYSKLCHSSVLISSPRHRLALCIGDFTLWNKQGIAIKHHHSQMTQNYGSRVEANLWFKGLWYFMVLESLVCLSFLLSLSLYCAATTIQWPNSPWHMGHRGCEGLCPVWGPLMTLWGN